MSPPQEKPQEEAAKSGATSEASAEEDGAAALFDRADEIFDRALDLPPKERADWVARACGGDDELRRLVERLLENTQSADELLPGAAVWGTAWSEDSSSPSSSGLVASGSRSIEVPSQILHYRVLEQIGGGGKGQVYRAEDTRLGRHVALNFLAPELQRDAYSRERFLREARAVSRLDHTNICPILEVTETPQQELFIAMVHYEGETLESQIARGPLEIDTALEIARQITAGLDAAHRQGILHRDVKPANVFITAEGKVKLLDFGLAKMADESGLTRSGQFLGTPVYMAPEQVAGHPSPGSDLWSLGVVLFEMLTGERPFPGAGTAAIYSILHVPPRRIERLRPEVPSRLAAIVDKLLAKKPENRYASAAALLEDLAAVRVLGQPAPVGGWIGVGELLFHCGPLNGRSFAASRPAWDGAGGGGGTRAVALPRRDLATRRRSFAGGLARDSCHLGALAHEHRLALRHRERRPGAHRRARRPGAPGAFRGVVVRCGRRAHPAWIGNALAWCSTASESLQSFRL